MKQTVNFASQLADAQGFSSVKGDRACVLSVQKADAGGSMIPCFFAL
jgi:hypothetical protein